MKRRTFFLKLLANPLFRAKVVRSKKKDIPRKAKHKDSYDKA